MRRAAPVAIAMAALLSSGCGSSAKSGARESAARAKGRSFPDLIAKVRSGVIRIETRTCTRGAIGTGFLVSPRLVATVEHVVDGAVTITLKRNGEVLGSGTVIGRDRPRDVALIRSSRAIAGYRFRLDARSPRLGDSVAAIGFPLGLPLSVTRGTVSGLDRTISIARYDRRRLVQTDAAVNHGNSGGPLLLTRSGSVVGLVDLGTTAANGLAFAVSAAVAAPLISAWRVAPETPSPASCRSAGNAPTQQAPLTYSGTAFTMEYPPGWTVENAETNHGSYYDTTITAKDDSRWLVRVDEGPGRASPTPEAAAAPVIAGLRKQAGYTELDMSRITFAGYPALRWEFTVPEGGVLLHKVDIFLTDARGNDWAVLGQTPDSQWAANQAALQSYLQTFEPY